MDSFLRSEKMLGVIVFIATLSFGHATYFITKVNETVHHNINLQDNEIWNPEMYAKKIILRNLTGMITSKSFSMLPEVEEIYFAHSSISAIQDDAFQSNMKLKILQFSYNTHLPVISNELLRNCRSLRSFSMGHNKEVEGIKENLFSNLRNLTHVEVTKERKMPKRISKSFFENSKNLKSIKLHFSNITVVDSNAFENLNRLQFLSLVENEIVEIGTSALKSLELSEIYLGWNKLSSFTGRELSNLRFLKNLDISFNPLTVVDLEQIRKNAPSLKVLSLLRTNLSCDDKKIIKMQESASLQIRMDLMEIEKCEARK